MKIGIHKFSAPLSIETPAERPVICSILISLSLLLIVLALVPITYSTSDDISFIWILSGADGYPADTFIPFTGQSLNYLFHYLYGSAVQYPWWGLLLYSTCFVACTQVCAVTLRQGTVGLLVLPAVLYFFFYTYTHISITIASALLVVAGVLCLLDMAIDGRSPREWPKGLKTIVAGSFAVAFVMRWQVSAFFLLPLATAVVFVQKDAARAIAAIVLVATLSLAADRALYSLVETEAQKEFLTYSKMHSKFQDTPSGRFHPGVTEAAMQAAGWSRDDYEFYASWVVYDDSKFNSESLSRFLAANRVTDLKASLNSALSWMAAGLYREKHHVLVLVMAIMPLIVISARRWRASPIRVRLASLAPVALAFVLIAFFLYYRFVPRIFIPLFVFVVCSAALIPGYLDAVPERTRLLRLPALVLVLLALQVTLVLLFSLVYVKKLASDREEQEFADACLQIVEEKTTVKTLVLMDPVTGLSLDNVSPLRERLGTSRLNYLPRDVFANSPRYFAILGLLHLSSGRQLMSSMVDSESIGVVLFPKTAIEGERTIRLWESYFEENITDAQVRLMPTIGCKSRAGRELSLYRIERRPDSAE